MSAAGKWSILLKTPMGDREAILDVNISGKSLTGTLSSGQHSAQISDGLVDGNRLTWTASLSKPMKVTVKFSAVVEADRITGTARHFLGRASFAGTRV